MIENLYKRKLLARNHVLTFAQFTGKTEADIEDMFEADFYLELVNEEFRNQLSQAITVTDLNLHHPRILVSIEAYLKKNPLKSGGFNHYRPARYFTENTGRLAQNLSAATLNRFEESLQSLECSTNIANATSNNLTLSG